MTGKIIKRDEVKELEGEAEGEIEGKSEGSLEGEWEGTLGECWREQQNIRCGVKGKQHGREKEVVIERVGRGWSRGHMME